MLLLKYTIFFTAMARQTQISLETRIKIVTLKKEGLSNAAIAKKLKVSEKGVRYCHIRYLTTGSYKDRKRSGQPRKTSLREDREIRRNSLCNRKLTAPQILSEFTHSSGKQISVSTIKNRLKSFGLKGRIAAKKPLLRPQNKIKRLQWAKIHVTWTPRMWKKVLWTDESKFQIFSSKRRSFVRRFPGERLLESCVVPTVKHGGGSCTVWGCFAGDKVGDLVKIDGIMNKEVYKDILDEHTIPSGKRLIRGPFIMQADNDPKHNAKLCKDHLAKMEREKILKVMSWPAQSPDLNPIELLWDELDRKVRASHITSQLSLWETLQKCWSEIHAMTLEKLIRRMPRVCAAVIKSKGGYFEESKI